MQGMHGSTAGDTRQRIRSAFLLITLLRIAVAFGDTTPAGSQPPSRPEPPQLLSSSSTKLSLIWRPPIHDGGTPVSGYILHGAAPGQPWMPVYDPFAASFDPDPGLRNYTVRGLWPGVRYRFKLLAFNAAGRSAFSEPAALATSDASPTVSAALPLAGPLHGGTRVQIRGSDLAFGRTVYLCRFGDDVVPATLAEAAMPERSILPHYKRTAMAAPSHVDDGRGVIECDAPHVRQLVGWTEDGQPTRLSSRQAPLSIALDGATFIPTGLTYSFHDELNPTTVSPSSGPLAGGTAVTVTGVFPRADRHFSNGEHAIDFAEAACNDTRTNTDEQHAQDDHR